MCGSPVPAASSRHLADSLLKQMGGGVGGCMLCEATSFGRNGGIFLPSVSFMRELVPAQGGQLPTCSHAAQRHQPPLGHPGQHHGHAVSTLQATRSREDIGRPLAELLQLAEVPAHLLPAAAHPPQGRAWGSPASLRERKLAGEGLGHSLGKVVVRKLSQLSDLRTLSHS